LKQRKQKKTKENKRKQKKSFAQQQQKQLARTAILFLICSKVIESRVYCLFLKHSCFERSSFVV
jgi:hypothetical protein